MARHHGIGRKKIRGWNRRLKAIQVWEALHSALPESVWEKGGRYHIRFYVAPWYMLEKRDPPLWFFRGVLMAFVRIHTAWKARLDATGIPYQLQLWVYEPQRYWTDLVVQMGDSPLQAPFSEIPRGRIKQPAAYYAISALDTFTWTLHEAGDYLEADDLEYYGYSPDLLEREGWRFLESEKLYFKKRGWMQVGILM